MAENEMKAEPALPERVRSMEGLGVTVGRPRKRIAHGLCTGFFYRVRSVPHAQVLG